MVTLEIGKNKTPQHTLAEANMQSASTHTRKPLHRATIPSISFYSAGPILICLLSQTNKQDSL